MGKEYRWTHQKPCDRCRFVEKPTETTNPFRNFRNNWICQRVAQFDPVTGKASPIFCWHDRSAIFVVREGKTWPELACGPSGRHFQEKPEDD